MEAVEETMSQKNNRIPIIVWTAVIGALGVIVGAAFGYLGAKQNAETQVQIAQENAVAQMTNVAVSVYGPIFATQTAEAKMTPAHPQSAPGEDSTLAVEYIPQKVFAYAGNNNPDGGWSALSVVYDDAHKLNYRFEYSLPEDKYGYAGMVFNFPKGYNLSEYKALTFTIIFKNPTDEIDLFIKDISQNSNTVRIKGNGDERMELRYDFTNFSNVNFNAVLEIGLFAKTDFTRGGHEVWITDVRLTK